MCAAHLMARIVDYKSLMVSFSSKVAIATTQDSYFCVGALHCCFLWSSCIALLCKISGLDNNAWRQIKRAVYMSDIKFSDIKEAMYSNKFVDLRNLGRMFFSTLLTDLLEYMEWPEACWRNLPKGGWLYGEGLMIESWKFDGEVGEAI